MEEKIDRRAVITGALAAVGLAILGSDLTARAATGTITFDKPTAAPGDRVRMTVTDPSRISGHGKRKRYAPYSAVTETPATHSWAFISDTPTTATTIWETVV